MKYRVVCVAGTFDGVHAGHQKLLQSAFLYGNHVVVGLTTDAFGKRAAPYQTRKQALEQWLRPFVGRFEIFPLDDPIGPAAIADYDALVVTAQNKHTAEHINIIRRKNRKKPLALLEVSLVGAWDAKPISSTRIRRGEIDMIGRLVMPDNMRQELSRPLGRILKTHTFVSACFTVGDLTTKTVVDAGIIPILAIIDNKVNRIPFDGLKNFLKTSMRYKVRSGPGYISQEAIDIIKSKKYSIIEVEGEEDLLVLPVIVEAPLGTVVYYGQPGVGIVEVLIDAGVKKQAIEYLNRFTS